MINKAAEKQETEFFSIWIRYRMHIAFITIQIALAIWLDGTAKKIGAYTEKLAEPEVEQSSLVAEAISAAEDASKRGDMNLAAALIVNAIQRQPAKMESAKRYVDLVIKAKDANLIAGAQRLLEQLLFQARPADVPKVAALLDQIAAASEKSPQASEPVTMVSLAQRLEEVRIGPLEDQADKLTDRLEKLLGIREELEAGGLLELNKVKILNDEIEITQACLKGVAILDAAKVRLANVAEAARLLKQKNNEKSRTYALASLQAAELVINDIWVVKHGTLPAAIAGQLQGLPTILKEKANEIQDEVDKVHVASAKQLWTDVSGKLSVYSSDLCSDRLRSCGKALVDCTDLASKTQGEKAKNEFRVLLQKIADKMEALRKEQFAKYQHWAVTETEKSREWFFDNWVKFESHVDDAISETRSEMQKIDFQLLAPETAQFVQDALASMLAECGAEKKAEVQRLFTVGSAKKKLEDF